MGMVLEFPANVTMRRLGETAGGVVEGGVAKILILPVIRVERYETLAEAARLDEPADAPRQSPRG
jgi:hypothetical protein